MMNAIADLALDHEEFVGNPFMWQVYGIDGAGIVTKRHMRVQSRFSMKRKDVPRSEKGKQHPIKILNLVLRTYRMHRRAALAAAQATKPERARIERSASKSRTDSRHDEGGTVTTLGDHAKREMKAVRPDPTFMLTGDVDKRRKPASKNEVGVEGEKVAITIWLTHLVTSDSG